jgi:hypothetical protein
LLAVAVAVAVVVLHLYVAAQRIVITVQQDVIRTDKVDKAEHKLPAELAAHHGQELLPEDLLEP